MSVTDLHSLALGIASKNSSGEIIEVYYPKPLLNPSTTCAEQMLAQCQNISDNGFIETSPDAMRSLASALAERNEAEQSEIAEALAGSAKTQVITVLRENSPPSSIPEAF